MYSRKFTAIHQLTLLFITQPKWLQGFYIHSFCSKSESPLCLKHPENIYFFLALKTGESITIITELITWTDKMSHIFSPYVMSSVWNFICETINTEKENYELSFIYYYFLLLWVKLLYLKIVTQVSSSWLWFLELLVPTIFFTTAACER